MEIGKKEKITNIREIWKKETEFSNWLTTESGLALLADSIGIEIENPKAEHREGNFPCDIVANLLGDENHIVVIENQYGRTNHDHLAKLLTYAAVNRAMTGIWIAEIAADDHRQVIDWLNLNTPVNIGFYLAELNAVRIGNSLPAPELNVVSKPNVVTKSTAGYTEAEKRLFDWRQKFWEDIHTFIRSTNPPYRLQKPGINHWSTISLGRSNFSLSMLLTPKKNSIGVELFIDPYWKQSAFEQLYSQKEEIESEIGRELIWMKLPEKKSSRILLEEKLDPNDACNRDPVKTWFAENTLRMYKSFRGRVLKLIQTE